MENFISIIDVFQNVAPLSVAVERPLKSSKELSFLSPALSLLYVLVVHIAAIDEPAQVGEKYRQQAIVWGNDIS